MDHTCSAPHCPEGPPAKERVAAALAASSSASAAKVEEEVVAANALDIAKRVLGRQRQLLDGAAAHRRLGAMENSRTGEGTGMSDLDQPAGSTGNFSRLTRQLEADRREVEKRLEHLEKYVDSRINRLESSLTAMERRQSPEVSGRSYEVDVARLMRESRALVTGAVSEVQALCKAHKAEVQVELEAKNASIRQSLEEMRESKEERRAAPVIEPPVWFGELETAVAALEHRLRDQRVAVDGQIARLQTEVDSSKLHINGLQEELVQSIQARVGEELERFVASAAAQPREAASSSKRLSDMESRMAALRVRVDVHDSRLSSMGDRVEGLCQQALDEARQETVQQREAILAEVDCQHKLLLQHLSPTRGDSAEDIDDSPIKALSRSRLHVPMRRGVHVSAPHQVS
mmetsp:Transcript_8483/g.19958  ORF Transcript_8483/g.19958 Transcript_8483/m.19958 type:complete len:403 (+) Transcript_8483:51-1259(+)